MDGDAHLQSLFYIIFRVPSKGAPPSGSPHRAPIKRDVPFPEPFNYISEVPVNGLPSHASQRGPYGERCPSPHPSSTHNFPVD